VGPTLATAIGTLALAATAALWASSEPTDAWLHQGGFLVVALASASLLLAAAIPGPVARCLSVAPLVWLGSLSYGLYVYHWPIFLALDAERTGLDGVALAAARLAPTLALAWASSRYLELPVRRGRLRFGAAQQVGLAVGSALLLLGGALVVRDLADERSVAATTPDVQLDGATTTSAAPVAVAPPRRVLVVGDSLLHQGLPTLRDRFGRRDILVEALGGPSEHLMFEQGVWLADVAAAIEGTDPDVVVLESCCGFGSARRDETYLLADGTSALPDTEATWAEWRRLADALSTVARQRGAATLWVLAPPAQTGGFYGPVEERIATANTIYRDLTACRGDLGIVDWGRLANPDGTYAAELPDAQGNPVKVRADDGLHFTLDGQALVADLTVDAVLAHWQAVGGRDAATPDPRASSSCGAGAPVTSTSAPAPTRTGTDVQPG
jgi:hypothetical protein